MRCAVHPVLLAGLSNESSLVHAGFLRVFADLREFWFEYEIGGNARAEGHANGNDSLNDDNFRKPFQAVAAPKSSESCLG